MTVIDRARQLEGYQCYLIEQWACSRSHPTFILTAFTGDPSHVIKVGVLSVLTNEEAWSPQLKAYMKAVAQNHARRKETPLGFLMITNLSSFPSSLTIILIPDGDIRRHRADFFVNENLKRLGCAGRTGITLAEPSASTQAKFMQLYKINDKVPLYNAVVELVKMCQLALVLFGQLESAYADGLLCDVTEKAITDWWVDIGTDYFNMEPNDGVLGPTTVAALVGTCIGARNRLNAYGAPVGKDVFEMENTKNAINYFQKAQRIHRTRRLDRQTLSRLHKATAKQASGEGRFVPRAIKSTVADLSGKGGEMVMEMVGAKDKANLADVETVDIERLVELVHGERAKWLWRGKAKRRTTRDIFDDKEEAPKQDEPVPLSRPEMLSRSTTLSRTATLSRTDTRRDGQEVPKLKRMPTALSVGPYGRESTDVDPLLRHAVLKRAKGRLKEAVGIRGHNYKSSKDETPGWGARNPSTGSIDSAGNDVSMDPRKRGGSSEEMGEESDAIFSPNMSQSRMHSRSVSQTDLQDPERQLSIASDIVGDRLRRTETVASTIPEEEDAKPSRQQYDLPSFAPLGSAIGPLLRRTQSQSDMLEPQRQGRHDAAWPRHLSFGAADEAMLAWIAPDEDAIEADMQVEQRLRRQLASAEEARQMRRELADLSQQVAQWVQSKIEDVEGLAVLAGQDVEQLVELYHPRKRECQSLQEGAQEVIAAERARLLESLKELDSFGAKLEYEMNSLRGKVEEVEEAVAELEKQVVYTESRVRELTRESGKEGWFAWLGRVSSGLMEQARGGRK